ncbi:TIGR02444 family protein [Pseudomonas sp. UBA6310]|uniref:TIGR02444 family protein n=1 Tax=Pseudomonas sp. UBA6310 TaxID=1947327 RepID=UPI00257ECBBD|nr:TIGR02444 family protein [Pseudomonas sp. UBA6310]
MPADLWSFALARYARPGVENACLALQAEGADVCLLLCGAWLGARRVSCTAARAEQLKALAKPWQATVVMPLRQLRQGWKAAAGSDAALTELREQVKALELRAEHELLRRLESASADWPEDASETTQDWLRALAGFDHPALQSLT